MAEIKHDWTRAEIAALFDLPFNELLFKAHAVTREYFAEDAVQLSTLYDIKTGACPEDCGYCSQSGHFNTGLEKKKFVDTGDVLTAAKRAKEAGATRFCMGAAWRCPPDKAMPALVDMIKEVQALGLETCLTAGMITEAQAKTFKEAGLDYYNHNIDTSPEYYEKVTSTRKFQDRLDTLENVRKQDLKVCCGGILGMGESREDRVGLLCELSNLPQHPQSVPINQLVPIPGTPLGDSPPIDVFEFVRTIAIARITMPASMVRLSAGRQTMSEEAQALCFFAGANSIFYGDKLLTSDNNDMNEDKALLERLGIAAA